MPLEVSRDVRNVSKWGGQLGLSLGSPQGIHTSLHLLQWKTSLHSSHCREIWPCFESQHHRIHSTWGRKLRVLLTLLLLRKEFSWCSCGEVAYHFNRIMGIPFLLEMIWHPWSFPRVPVLKLVFLEIWNGCLRESLELPKVRKATCLVWRGMEDGLDPIEGTRATSRVDLGYSEQFHVPLVESLSF